MGMNIIQIMGHLGADAETRVTPNGQKVTTLRVATNVRRSGKEETVWYRVTLWHDRMGERFEKLLPYLKKGSGVVVVGELGKPEIYTDKNGQQQVSLDVTGEFIRFSPFGKSDRGESSTQYSQSTSNAGGYAVNEPFAGSVQTAYGQGSYQAGQSEDNDLPF